MSKKSPQLRFEGFTDDWEERKLSSGLREYTDRVIVEDDKEYYQISVRNNFGGITLRGSKMGNKIGRKRQAKINLTKYPQTLIFTRQTVEQGGIGWVDKYCDGAIVTENMPTISLDTSVFSNYFLTNLFQTRIFYKNAILDNIEGGSAQIAIHESKFLSSTLLFPNLDEQEKIGQFFKQLDDTIDLHQRKLDLLKEQKKGFLQKMFPKNGEKVPELRFAGFADDWEERKLGDEFKKVSERNDGSFGRNHWISVAKMYFQSPEKVQSNNIDTRTYVMREGDIAFEGHPNSEFKFGRFVANDIGAGVVSELFPIYRHQHEYDNNYWKNAIQIESTMAPIFAKSITSSGNSSNKLDTKHFLRQKILVPQINEQKKIGSFFKRLDDTIALHQRKLDLLKEQKKGFLQKMFV